MQTLGVPVGATSITLPAGAEVLRNRRVIVIRRPMRAYVQRGLHWWACVGLTRKLIGWVRVKEIRV